MLSVYPELALPFTFHGDGFVREAAVRMIAEQPITPFSLAAALYRVNDWVQPVRETAARSFASMLQSASPRAGASAILALILESTRWGRWGSFREELFLPALAQPEVAGQIAIMIRDSERGRMSAILRQLLSRPVIDDLIEDLAANARIASVRVVATDALIFGRAKWPTGEYHTRYVDSYPVREPEYAERRLFTSPTISTVLMRAAADRASIVRKTAADALIRNLADAETRAALIAGLKDDRDKSIRERIAFVLRQPNP